MKISIALLLAAVLSPSTFAQKTTIEETDKNFAEAAADADTWIYNDLDKGFEQARAAQKPLMVVYRCIP